MVHFLGFFKTAYGVLFQYSVSIQAEVQHDSVAGP